MPSFAAITLGCKVNQYETQALSALLTALGLSRQDRSNPSDSPPDLVVINTCAVTSAAVAKCRRLLRQAVRKNPSADLLIVGCAVTAHAGALEQSARRAGATGRIEIIGHGEDLSARVRQWLARIEETRPDRQANKSENQNIEQGGWYNTSTPQSTLAGQRRQRRAGFQERTRRNPIYGNVFNTIRPSPPNNVNSPFQPSPLPAIDEFADHQRAFVKVQDGCAFCSYCVVPHLRRAFWSRPAEEVVTECRNLVEAGYHEVVLCGIFLGAYGQHTALRRNWTTPPTLPALLEQLLDIEGLFRIRLSSLDPLDIDPATLDLYARNSRLAPHFHLSIQSGSDRILERMNRQYRRGDVLVEIGRIRERLDRPAFGTDIIVGFPSETENDFEQTLDLVAQAGLSQVHLFPFSPRPLTAAWAWRKEMPPPEQMRQRCRRLAELAADLGAQYRRQFVGQCVDVLVEHPDAHTPAGMARGLTDRYIDVVFPLPPHLASRGDTLLRQVVTVKVEAATPQGVTGSIRPGLHNSPCGLQSRPL